MFKIGHSNDKKHTYKDGSCVVSKGSGLLSVRTQEFSLFCVFLLLGVVMRATNPIEPACLESALLKANANANVYDLGLKQDEGSRLRRVRDLEHENALLMRMVSETQVEIARLRELLSTN